MDGTIFILSRKARIPALVALALGFSGCSSIGPTSVARDRFDYSTAISDSWKRQTLLNIVKLRYLDPPIFVDVGQIVGGYTLETGGVMSGQVYPGSGTGDFMNLGVSGKYTDRPTITYTPLTGNRFMNGMMTPITPGSLFGAIQSGWQADLLIPMAVVSLNGVRGLEPMPGGGVAPDPKFARMVVLMRKLQRSGTLSLRVSEDPATKQATLLAFRTNREDAQGRADAEELRALLGLEPGREEFRLVFGSAARDGTELAIVTRSLIHVIGLLSTTADIPPEDIAGGRATPGLREPGDGSRRTFHIRCSDTEPKDAFVAVPYRGRWFWIDDRDLETKRTFAFVMLLFSMASPGDEGKAPLLTIPTG